MATATQTARMMVLETPLGKDVLLPRAASATERVSGLFEIELDLLAERSNASKVKADKLIGKQVTLAVASTQDFEGGPRRHFTGMVKRFTQGAQDVRFVHYRMQVVPWSWLLTQTSDCRIFQNMTIPDIIKKVFDELKADYAELVKYEDKTSGPHIPIDYCVQYRETDFNFVSRLMEQEGIFYFFKHTADAHTLIFGDSPQVHQTCPTQSKFRYMPEGGMGEWEDLIISWQVDRVMRPGKFTFRDHNFQMPKKNLEVTTTTNGRCAVGNNTKLEIYDYQGEYAERFNKPDERLGEVEQEGDKLVKARMQEAEAPHQEITAATNCRSATSGHKFDLVEHFDGAQNGSYVIASVKHSFRQVPGYQGEDDQIEDAYSNSFTCIPDGVPFRPPRRTPKPVVEGLQSAVVVGPSGEEIHTDKYGRIKVQFHWDREGKKDENSSCWVRVAQPQAGKRWGSSFTPRIGQEVLIAFMEGDPDQPIIVGSVYNADQMPPYNGDGPDGKHPSNNAVTGFKSCSTKGGEGFNEIRFVDDKGSEQFFIHGQKDFDMRILEESRTFIGQSQHLNVKEHRKEKIEGDQFEEIVGKQIEKVGDKHHRDVGGEMVLKIGGDMHLDVGGDRMQSVSGGDSLSVGAAYQISASQKYAVGAQEVHINAGMNCVIEAGASLTIKVGGNFVNISPAGVAIQGTTVLINSGGMAGSGSGSNPASPKSPDSPEEPDEAEKDAKTGTVSNQ